jgi:hypothetical protein
MANTFNLGNGSWAQKIDKLLAYNAENDNYKPLPFDFDRASSATRVNKQGLIETVGIDEPRIDFLNNTKGHLLLEPSRKNDITDYTGASFSAFSGASITANDSVSPDGSTNATLITTTGSANELIQQAGITIFSGQSYTVSGYFKLKSGTLSDLDNAFKGLDGLNGGGITGSTFNSTLTSEWQRLSFTVTSSTTSGRVQIKCEDAAEILVWGLQLEQGSYATTPIPTQGSAVTRNGETLVQDNMLTSLFNRQGMAFYLEVEALASDGVNKEITINDGSGADRFVMKFNTGNQLNAFTISSLGTTNFSGSTSGLDITQNNKFAASFDGSIGYIYVNGTQVNSRTINNVLGDNLSKISFGNHNLSNNIFYGKIKDCKIYNTALTPTELTALTS